MIKRTLYFGIPAYLSSTLNQLNIKVKQNGTWTEKSEPVEDMGVVILDNSQITITLNTISQLLENNVAVITCNNKHLPRGLILNLDGHTLQSQKFKKQIEASDPLKKSLWQQTIEAKIANQAAVLKSLGKDTKKLDWLAARVKSGDSKNNEAQAAAIYWANIFSDNIQDFKRERNGEPPNNLLNYGYAILRGATARALTASGLLPTLGLFHKNQYNAYCLADDIMEPYRPYVDRLVSRHCSGTSSSSCNLELTSQLKKQFLEFLQEDVYLAKERSPLLIALLITAASLAACFEGKKKKLIYPRLK